MNHESEKIVRKSFIKQFYKGNKLAFGIAIFAALFVGGLNLIVSWLMQQIIDCISGGETALDLKGLLFITVLVVLAIVLFGVLEYISKPRFMKKAMQQYKEYAFESLLKKNIHTFNEEATATYISALSNDAGSIEANYLEKQFGLISGAVMFIGAFIMMLVYSPLLTGVVVLLIILPIIASLLVGNRMETAELTVSKRNVKFTDTLKEAVCGFAVIKSFKAEKAVLDLFIKSNREVEDAKCKKEKISIIIGTISAVAGIIAQLGVFIVGAYLALSGKAVTPGVVLVFVNLMNYILQPISVLPEILANRKASLALIDKLCQALNENVRKERLSISDRLRDAIELKQLSFGYKEGEEVLQNINLRFQAGKSYALVGASGSGKSTILNLLLAGYDNYSGSISYDGQELRNINSESLYDIVSVVQQNVVIFNASVRENITMFKDVPKEDVDKVIAMSGLLPFIREHGEEYLCGENGNALSGGEKQRISIARSLLRRSSVLLVDEATAALDKQTAHQVSNSILDIDGVTKIVVTHSLEEALLKRYDEIIVLKAGKVVETGAYEALMEKKEYFYSLYTISQD